MTQFTWIEGGESRSVDATVSGERVRIAPAELGWELKDEGLCRGELCVPVRDRAALQGVDGLDIEALASLLDAPLALDVAEAAAALGVGATERAQAMADLLAPDFTLPDLGGRMHSLAEHRGKKVLLVVYASW